MKNQLDDEKMKEKFTDEDKKCIAEETAAALQWMEGKDDAEAADFEAKKKELEGKFNPIMMRIYQATGGAPDMGGMGGAPDMGGANADAGNAAADDLD